MTQTANINVYRSSLRGYRESNEDVEVFVRNLDNPRKDPKYANVDCFVICDGHTGADVSNLVSKYLLKYLISVSALAKYNESFPLSKNYVHRVYNHIQNKLKTVHHDIAIYQGSTALVVLRYRTNHDGKYHLQIINLGDCRAIVSNQGRAMMLTADHRPHWPEETERITNVNQITQTPREIFFDGDWRVGNLSVSRSFGDLDNVPQVTHHPSIYSYELGDFDEFIIMACDGLWESLRNEDAVNFVAFQLKQGNNRFYSYNGMREEPPNVNIATKLARYAISRGSTDNVSVIIIEFV